MRAILLATTALSPLMALSPLTALAADIEVTSAIRNVTVYADGASVQRHVATALPAGGNVVILRGLPAALDQASLRVTGAGDAALAIVSVDSRMVPGDARPSVDADLERQLEALRADRDGLAGQIEASEVQKASIQRFAQASPERLSAEAKPLDVERWPDAWRAIGEGLAEVNAVLRRLRDKTRVLDDEIAALERARPQAGRPGAPKRDVLIVTDGMAGKTDLTVSYQIAAAGWTPVYDAKLKTGGDKPSLEIVRRASVQQRTGEDWTGVALSLSTVRLRRGTAAPELATQTLTLADPYEPPPMPLSRAMPASPAMKTQAEADGRARDSANAERQAAAAPVAAAPVLASVDAGAYEATFSVPGAVDLPQDGRVKTFTLGMRSSEPVLGARVTSALDTTAYLDAAFTNDEDVPVLAGEVSLQRDGTFIGRGRVGFAASGDKVRLGFGADDRIKVLRTPVARKENDNGAGPNRSETQDFRTTVKNLHAFPIRITVIDRIPVSENTAISVTPLDTNTAPTDKLVDDKRGVFAWASDYKPGEQKDIRLGWRVRWPGDRDLRRR